MHTATSPEKKNGKVDQQLAGGNIIITATVAAVAVVVAVVE